MNPTVLGASALSAEEFRNPGKQYRPSPFYSWNGRLEPAEITRQVRLLRRQGFGGFFMHSRVGLETPYMSEEWMQAIAAALETARQCDMEAWFYDEDKWPSGFAGGVVPAKGAAFRSKGLQAQILAAGDLLAALATPGPELPEDGLCAIYELDMYDDGSLRAFRRLLQPPAPDAAGRGTR